MFPRLVGPWGLLSSPSWSPQAVWVSDLHPQSCPRLIEALLSSVLWGYASNHHPGQVPMPPYLTLGAQMSPDPPHPRRSMLVPSKPKPQQLVTWQRGDQEAQLKCSQEQVRWWLEVNKELGVSWGTAEHTPTERGSYDWVLLTSLVNKHPVQSELLIFQKKLNIWILKRCEISLF